MKPTSTAFYHAHHYTFPVLYVLGVVNDHPCLVKSSIDIGFITEFDPTWNVPTLSSWFNPEAFLFANPLALAACAADCVAATVDKPLASTPWCAGCQGSLHPMQGHVPHHTGGVSTSLLLTQRLQAKMHKVGVAWQYHGSDALCGPHPNIVMNRQAYKTQMLYPVPNTKKLAQPASTGANTLPTPGTSTGAGNTQVVIPPQAAQNNSRCCQNLWETSIVWGAGKEFPIKGEDFAYLLFRKRNCCMILNK
jgi:conjugal transfer pilus assembly protein TraU